jgi:hypothetical protein
LPVPHFRVGIGLVTVYTSLIVAETKFRNPHLKDYAEIGRLLFGNVGYYFVATMLLLLLILTVGSHVLTGIIAFESLFDHKLCSVYFGVISAFLLFVLALPKTFDGMDILAYVDFASIAIAVVITIVVSAIESRNKLGGLQATTWYAFIPADQAPGFVKVMLAITNIVLAYAVAQCLPSFMSELKRPQDYKKSIWTLGIAEISFYTIIGAVLYYLKGHEVKAPALLGIAPKMQKVVFGVACPVIFISGAINGQTAAKFLYDLIFLHSPKHKYMNTKMGIITWIALGLTINIVAWVAAEAIPSFSTFLGLIAALFTACFTFTLPACMYFMVLRGEKGRRPSAFTKWTETAFNGLIFIGGVFILFVGCGECFYLDLFRFLS